ncbi:hypothetical protein [Aquimarina algiphila]|uniref:hypothetical protein n=1 Tax=Aquimarina algiphila TaxID=2047982 RepID=UPI002492A3E6|nr:hypothetical protein [Aquimarina algiphila]
MYALTNIYKYIIKDKYSYHGNYIYLLLSSITEITKVKFLRRLISPKKSKEEIRLEWNETLKKVSDSLINDKLEYPIILLCHVPWSFQVFKTPSEIISESISGQWGVFPTPFDQKELVIDSNGKVYKISNKHYHKETKVGFSYPSILQKESETLENLKNKINKGSKSLVSDVYPEKESEITEMLNDVGELISIAEVIDYVGNYMKF